MTSYLRWLAMLTWTGVAAAGVVATVAHSTEALSAAVGLAAAGALFSGLLWWDTR